MFSPPPKIAPPDAYDIQNGKFCYFKFLSKEIGIKVYEHLPVFCFSRNYILVDLNTKDKFWLKNNFTFFVSIKDLDTFEKYKVKNGY